MRKFMLMAMAFMVLSPELLQAQTEEARREHAKKPVPIVQVNRNKAKEIVSMDTPILTLRDDVRNTGVEVTIYGAVHIADKAYFQSLDKKFAKHEVLLYELVVEDGVVPEKGGAKSLLGKIQGTMAHAIGLVHQGDEIDYQAKNFVHADMAPTELKQKMTEVGDTPMSIVFGVMSDFIRQGNLRAAEGGIGVDSAESLLSFVQSPDGARDLKRLLVKSLKQSKAGLRGTTASRYLIEYRNQECVKELVEQIEDGKKDIAIFYGAAHLPDMVKRLQREKDLFVVDTQWVSAIDLRKPTPEESPMELVFQSLEDDFIRTAMEDPRINNAVKRVLEDPKMRSRAMKIIEELN